MRPAAKALGPAAAGLALAAALRWTSGAADLARPPSLPDGAAKRLWDQAGSERATARDAAALSAVRRLLASFPHEPRYLSFEAQELERLGRPRDAARAWELFMLSAPFPTDACPSLGDDYARAGRADLALEAHRRCLALDPSKPDLMVYYARALENAGREDEAAALAAEALAADPRDADAATLVIRVRLKKGDLAAAKAASDALLAVRPDDTDALLSAALVARAGNDLPRARALLTRAIRASPGYADLYRVLITVEHMQGDEAAAAKTTDELAELVRDSGGGR
jgi:tetratricopeptide (TPR) repeat protein